LFNSEGKELNRFGTTGCYFNAITVDTKYIYICDWWEHRIELITKDTGVFLSQWGKEGRKKGEFCQPRSIFYDELEKLIYIGDQCSVQLFVTDADGRRGGQCIQRLDGSTQNFWNVSALCQNGDRLHVGDANNRRVHVFRRNE